MPKAPGECKGVVKGFSHGGRAAPSHPVRGVPALDLLAPARHLGAMPPLKPDELLARLAAMDIQTSTVSHPPIFTVEEGRDHWRFIPGAHCKNLFLKDEKGALFLLVALENAEIRLNKLHKRIGCKRLSFARTELLMEVLGVAPGSVTPFALVHDTERRVTVLLDAAMMRNELLNYHPLSNDMTTTIRREDLLKFLRGLGYEPREIDLEGLGEA